MSADHWLLIALLSASTLGLRAVGYLAGAAMMKSRFWARVLEVFPGCLVTALVASALAQGGPADIIAAAVALATATLSRSIILTMLGGMAAFVAASTVF